MGPGSCVSERSAGSESSEHPLVATILARASALMPAPVGPAHRLERLARAAIDTYPNEPWVRFVAGMSLYRIGQPERAESELRSAWRSSQRGRRLRWTGAYLP